MDGCGGEGGWRLASHLGAQRRPYMVNGHVRKDADCFWRGNLGRNAVGPVRLSRFLVSSSNHSGRDTHARQPHTRAWNTLDVAAGTHFMQLAPGVLNYLMIPLTTPAFDGRSPIFTKP